MKKSVKFSSLFLVLVLISTMFTFSAFATTFFERENNDSYASANTITLGETYSGIINDYYDVDYYKVVPSANGKITVKFLHTYENSSSSWDVCLYRYCNGEYTQLSKCYVHLNDNESISLPYIGAVKDGTYYIVVSGVKEKNYKISTTFTKSEYYEKEINDVYSTANKITLGKTYSGIISDYYDVDYYKVVPDANGKITVKFLHTYENSSSYWNVYLYRYCNGEYTKLSECYVYLNDNESISLPYIGAVKDGTYYIVVSGVEEKNYKISTTFTKSEYYEKEINDVYSTANKITLGKTYSGIISDYYDVDYYKVVPDANGKITVKFLHTYENSSSYWDVCLYEYYKGEYTQLSKSYVYLNDNKSISLPYIGAVKGRTYYIVVSGVRKINYSISTSFTIPVSKPKKVTASPTTTSAKLTWSKVSGVNGYEVYKYTVSTKKYTKVASTSKTTYTIKKLKSGTMYRYSVRAYKVVNNKKYYSSYTSPLPVNTKCTAPKIKLSSTKSKTATVSWAKVSGAKKYKVYKSTNNKKWTKVTETTKLKYVINKLTGKKKIYVKVIAINASGKGSAYSSVKSVTVKK